MMNNDIIKNRIVGFTAGTFDLLHAGHFLMLKEAQEQCNYLIVGLQIDPSIDRPLKNKPIQTIEERKVQLEGCKYVDEVIVYNTEKALIDLLLKVKPDIRILGEDWKEKEFTGKLLGIPVFFNTRKHSFSSTDLRKRIYIAEQTKRKILGEDF